LALSGHQKPSIVPAIFKNLVPEVATGRTPEFRFPVQAILYRRAKRARIVLARARGQGSDRSQIEV